ncbi:MAG: chemotaxis protein CheW [Helicobacteraceae bacterium]|nr:chemotaxis protein CheW [Helicobacteraceae bacterium]
MDKNTLAKINSYIPEVTNYNNVLNSLAERWNLLTLLGQMSNIGMDMSDTREAFEHLTQQLLVKLGGERLKKLSLEMNSKAQVAVDIVIRNLFERTADIGFLATDDDIREYLQYLLINKNTDDLYRQEKIRLKKALVQRFNEYVAKYSVYDNIVLLSTTGEILAQLDQNNPVSRSRSPFIDEALTTSQDYVEFYDYCDINPSKQKTLIYAYKVTKTTDPDSEILGVLALFFKFEDEMSGIFSNLLEKDDWMNIMLLDSSAKVISSSDSYQIPLGATMQKVFNCDYKIVRFAGREYLAKTCKTKGYQGFFGLDWLGHVMIPLENAFTLTNDALPLLDPNILHAVVRNSNLFGDELITIPNEAQNIQKELDITVWNGNVKIANTKNGDNSFSKSLLIEISKTGSQTKSIFEESIANLNNTVISSILNDVLFLAKLAIDIMDRNLYERANDCRWWALTTYFRRSLQSPNPDKEAIAKILSYINNLYTVYTNLFVYDKSGLILAVSNEDQNHLVGTKLSNSWVLQTLELTDSQAYSVSPFSKSALYDNRATYIYGASITSLQDNSEVLGGIGIVFDSQPELYAMLADTLPKDKDAKIQENYFALFCDKEKNIISSTSQELKVGDVLHIDEAFFDLQTAQSYANIIEYKGKYYAVGSSLSKGYREYKVDDNYTNDLLAIIFVEIADAKADTLTHKSTQHKSYSYTRPQLQEETTDISTFFLGDIIYGIESQYIVSSLSNQSLTKIIGCNDYFIGVISYMGKTIGVVALYSLITGEKFTYDHTLHNIVLLQIQDDEGRDLNLAIAIDQIFDSPEIANRDIQNYKSSISGSATLTKAVVKPEKDIHKEQLLSILDVHAIYNKMAGFTTKGL